VTRLAVAPHRRQGLVEASGGNRVAHEAAREFGQRGARRAAQGGAQQGLFERGAVTIEEKTQRGRRHQQQARQLPGAARQPAHHQREQRVVPGDGAVEIEYGDGHPAAILAHRRLRLRPN